jgi:hypothetical protein
VIWDYAYYWGVLAQFAFQGRLTDLHALGSLREDMLRCMALNAQVQAFFRAWSAVSAKRNPAVMHDQASLPWFAALNASLNDRLDDAGFLARIRESGAMLQGLAAQLLATARQDHPQLQAPGLEACLTAGRAVHALSS